MDPNQVGQYSYSLDNSNIVPIISELASDGTTSFGSTSLNIDGKKTDVVTSGYGYSINYAVNQALKPTFTGTATLGNLSNGTTFVSVKLLVPLKLPSKYLLTVLDEIKL